ncbi:glycosyltransferase [Desulfovibrio sp. 86]|uniref:Glycosyl transferase family 2 n=1 Tax=uncultured Desulfovibrio sp. TaxID=167968 RepID=A0A212L9X1_9BACT|nr:glycosyltransferase [Desulfovibrio sp. 86]SCM74129.1 Glycosyl transferase family 2 [uncultured Desulfovibrio sp.]VZH34652.1 Glycosyl transferase family 2 [Desulfovibrio sp. 86]
MASPPLVSVIIPTYNYAQFLPEAVHSVLRQRADNLDVEIIVVDDGSTDNTQDVARQMQRDIVYVRQQKSGVSTARNTGIQKARGDFVVFLDADDVLMEEVLSTHLDMFAKHPHLDMSLCRCFDYHTQGSDGANCLWPLMRGYWNIHICCANVAPIHSFMLREKVIRQAGLFNVSLTGCEDYEYWLRCFSTGCRAGLAAEGLVIYRRHQTSTTTNREHMLLHEVSLRSLVANMLDSSNLTDSQEKLGGWLALASGCLNLANQVTFCKAFALKMQDMFVRALQEAERLYASSKGSNADLRCIQRYYPAQAIKTAGLMADDLTPDAINALKLLVDRYPYFAECSAAELDSQISAMSQHLQVSGIPGILQRFAASGS